MKITPTKKSFGRIKPGMPFELKDAAAKHLIKAGLVKEFDEAPTPKAKRTYRTRAMQAEA